MLTNSTRGVFEEIEKGFRKSERISDFIWCRFYTYYSATNSHHLINNVNASKKKRGLLQMWVGGTQWWVVVSS